MAIVALAIPKWGIEMEEGTVTEWRAELGSSVAKGDELVDIESDKIVNTLEATYDGILRRRFAEVDDTLFVGQLIGVIADESESDEAIDAFVAEFNASVKGDDSDPSAAATAVPDSATAPSTPTSAPAPSAHASAPPAPGKVRVSPPVKRKAQELGVAIDTVVGTGKNGRITLTDVENAASGEQVAGTPTDQSSDHFTVTKMSATQTSIAKRLVDSKQSIPHFYLRAELELDALLAKRESLNAMQDTQVSINSMIVWCVAQTLKAVPQINAQLLGDELRQFSQADISVAVATERGLLTPVVRAADTMTAVEVATAIAQLVEKARTGKLQREEIDGGSFTVSNLGMYGVKSFEAIVNPPQVAILALGQAQKQMLVRDNAQTVVATVVSASLSCDHRVVDGALGGKFLSALKKQIETMA